MDIVIGIGAFVAVVVFIAWTICWFILPFRVSRIDSSMDKTIALLEEVVRLLKAQNAEPIKPMSKQKYSVACPQCQKTFQCNVGENTCPHCGQVFTVSQ